mmetsp:Transcript_76986/g.152491  ORF Transcript_76986/g.152491 Transcript_76986/m.152491 type:complete len:246 (+) Transcript_76986:2352-3089(+)
MSTGKIRASPNMRGTAKRLKHNSQVGEPGPFFSRYIRTSNTNAPTSPITAKTAGILPTNLTGPTANHSATAVSNTLQSSRLYLSLSCAASAKGPKADLAQTPHATTVGSNSAAVLGPPSPTNLPLNDNLSLTALLASIGISSAGKSGPPLLSVPPLSNASATPCCIAATALSSSFGPSAVVVEPVPNAACNTARSPAKAPSCRDRSPLSDSFLSAKLTNSGSTPSKIPIMCWSAPLKQRKFRAAP